MTSIDIVIHEIVIRSNVMCFALDISINTLRGRLMTLVIKLLDKNDMLYVILQGMNEFILSVKAKQNPELNPFSKLFEGLDSDYLISLNTGGIWNVISLWVRRGMKDDPEDVKRTIAQYLIRISSQKPKLST